MGYLYVMTEHESRKRDRETPFSQWLNAALERKGIDLAELGRRVGSDYNYMWRLSAGLRKRPGYELTRVIGDVLGDLEGALVAANFTPGPKGPTKGLTTVTPKGRKITIENWEGELSPEERQRLAALADAFLDTHRH